MKRKWFYPAVIAAGALLIALIIHYSLRERAETAPVILPTPAATETAGGPGGEPAESDSPRAEVSPETVQAVIGTISRAESYSRVITVESFWDGGSSRSEVSVHARGGDYLITELRGDVIKNTLIVGGGVWVWYGDDETAAFSAVPVSPANADMYQRLLTYEDILALDVSDIRETGYVQYLGESCVRAEYVTGGLGYIHTVYISVSSGLIMGAQIKDGDTMIYLMSSDSVDLTTPDDELFAPPAV